MLDNMMLNYAEKSEVCNYGMIKNSFASKYY
jgi:hypothetical protein